MITLHLNKLNFPVLNMDLKLGYILCLKSSYYLPISLSHTHARARVFVCDREIIQTYNGRHMHSQSHKINQVLVINIIC